MAPSLLQIMISLIEQHHRRVLAVRQQTTARVGLTWDRFANIDEESAVRFVTASVLVVNAAVTAAGVLANGLFTALDDLTGNSGFAPAIAEPVIRGGVALDEVYRRPIVTARKAIGAPMLWDDAMRRGRDRATSTAQTDVMLANRQAISDNGDARPWVVGYRRVLTGRSCSLCAYASTQRYRSAELAPIHEHCDCDLAPIYGERDPGRVIDDQRLRQLKRAGIEPGDKQTVTVVEHGELGAVLVDTAHRFTGPADLN